jgi:hypothetical protein
MTSPESPGSGRSAHELDGDRADIANAVTHDPVEASRFGRTLWPADPVMRFATEHPLILWAGIAAVVLVVKVLIEVRGGTESALTVVQGAGAVGVLLSLALSWIPALAPAVATMAFLAVFDLGRQSVASVLALRPVSTTVGIAAALVTLAVTSVLGIALFVAVVALVYIVIYLVRRRQARHAKVPERARRSDRLMATSLGFAVGAILLFPGMWVPPERLSMTDGSAEVAFVISTQDGWATLLRESDRSIDQVKMDEIVARKVCRVGRGPAPTLLDLTFGDSAAAVPSCR